MPREFEAAVRLYAMLGAVKAGGVSAKQTMHRAWSQCRRTSHMYIQGPGVGIHLDHNRPSARPVISRVTVHGGRRAKRATFKLPVYIGRSNGHAIIGV